MDARGLCLLIPEKADVERDAVADAWVTAGGTVQRLGRFWDPPKLVRDSVRIYGNDTFCLVLQQKLDLHLLFPADELILGLPDSLLGRRLWSAPLNAAAHLVFPKFVKPLVPKLFPGRVYRSSAELDAECVGLTADTTIIVSEPVTLLAEARCFLLDGVVADSSIYEGNAELTSDVAQVAVEAIRSVSAPRTLVVDVGLMQEGRWCVVEFNAVWGAGLNGCRAERVLPCIEMASRP